MATYYHGSRDGILLHGGLCLVDRVDAADYGQPSIDIDVRVEHVHAEHGWVRWSYVSEPDATEIALAQDITRELEALADAGVLGWRVDEARALARVGAPTAAGVVAGAHGRTEASGAHPEGAATPSSTIREVAHVA